MDYYVVIRTITPILLLIGIGFLSRKIARALGAGIYLNLWLLFLGHISDFLSVFIPSLTLS